MNKEQPRASQRAPHPLEQWHVVLTKPRAEVLAEQHLRHQNYTVYLPRLKLPRRQRGLWRDSVEPLFPRYLFLRLSTGQNAAPVRSTRGVTGFVHFGTQMALAPTSLIESLQEAENTCAGIHQESTKLFTAGERVRVLRGPFAGLEGLFHLECADQRVVILLDLLGRPDSRVTLSRHDLVPVKFA